MTAKWTKPVALSAYPVQGRAVVTQGFGGDFSHNKQPYSVDFRAAKGDSYHAVGTGKVVYVDKDGGRDWGNFVTYLLDSGVYVTHAHFGKIKVNVGDTVWAGTYLGDVGDSGFIDGVHAHIHFGTKLTNGVADGSDDDVPPAFFSDHFGPNEVPSPVSRDIRSTDVYGTAGNDGEQVKPDNFQGTSAANRMFGGGGDDFLEGLGGNDQLWGGTGSDTLVGGSGRDEMTGGRGLDYYDFNSVREIDRDVILDFSGRGRDGDKISLKDIDAKPSTSRDDAFSFIGNDSLKKAGDLRVVSVGNNKYEVTGDVTGDGKADFTFYVYSQDPLTSSDFLL